MSLCLETRKDVAGGILYASRNHNHLRHTYEACGANRANVDWNLTLRQVRKQKSGTKGLTESASAPTLRTMERYDAAMADPALAKSWRRGSQQEPKVADHPEGTYHYGVNTETIGHYQNFANSEHMLNNLDRVSSQKAHGIDWQLNLRSNLHKDEHKPPHGWKRHFARPQQSFDMMAENCSAQNEEYQKSFITPQDRRPDRRCGAISIASIRDDPMSFRRWPGCEGTQVGQWRHLIEDTSKGYKSKRHLQAETTLREHPSDKNGAKICDNRSDGCVAEMLGKKKWARAVSTDQLSTRGHEHKGIDYSGDPKLYHLHQQRVLGEPDEDNRGKRMTKQPRTDVNISEQRTPLMPKSGEKKADETSGA
jgi:hypothetical protein